jgi:hypothetical protein
MDIFISWSGDKSKKVAELFKRWLPQIIQSLSPWYSPDDIGKGAVWFNEITEKLKSVNFSIICLTKENKEAPWILFEAGAIAKGIPDNKVYTFLVDLEVTDIMAPLSSFNHTKYDKEEIKKLIKDINEMLVEKKLSPEILDNTFDKFWPDFECEFRQIETDDSVKKSDDERSDNDILKEILLLNRSFDKRLNYLENNGHINKILSYYPPSVIQALVNELMTDEIDRDIIEKKISRLPGSNNALVKGFIEEYIAADRADALADALADER